MTAPGALRLSRAVDREKMAAEIERVVEAAGGTVARDDLMSDGKRIWLDVRFPGGALTTIELDGEDAGASFVLPWVLRGKDGWRFSHAFGRAAGGPVNASHGRKCTGIAETFPDLLASLERVGKVVSDGAAYEDGTGVR